MWIFRSFWPTVSHLDKSKINLWIAFRNSLAVAIPLGIGIAMNNPLAAVAVATGALNVSYSDGTDPYSQRARRMLAWTILGGVAVFVGSVTGQNSWLAVLVAAIWAFVAGLAISVSIRAGDLGLNTLVIVIVFAARGAMSAEGAAEAGLLVIGGGLLQMSFALLLWPIHRHQPERRAIGDVYNQLLKDLDPSAGDPLATPLQSLSPPVQDAVAALGRDHSIEGERFRLLFDQADRLRMSTFVLFRLRSEVEHRERAHSEIAGQTKASIDHLLQVSRKIIAAAGQCLATDACVANEPVSLRQLEAAVDSLHQSDGEPALPLARELSSAVDLLAGQLRVVAALAAHATTEGSDQFAGEEKERPWKLQLSGWLGTLRANLDPRSTYFRHAIRMASCVAIGDMIGRYLEWQRTYWLPMTIAVVLKPDFATTISRGVLRLAGTFTGLVLATLLHHLLPASALSSLFLVGLFTFFMRSLGPANYGVFSVAISGLIVFLIAATGVSPREVVVQRALNTTAGGLFALIAYIAWPTWERTQVSEVMAEMLDASRAYFQAIARRFENRAIQDSQLDSLRGAWRRARSNAEASVDRTSTEPHTSPESLDCLTAMLASSHVLVHSIMAMEADLVQGQAQTPPDAFRKFANDVELTLYFLGAALRGSPAAFETLPHLREDHRRMVEARDEFARADELLLIETDRITVTLNTLREQVLRFSK